MTLGVISWGKRRIFGMIWWCDYVCEGGRCVGKEGRKEGRIE